MKNIFTSIIIASLFLNSIPVFSQMGLSGVKTIDPLGAGPNNYTNFATAINALNSNGVAVGGVTFNVVSGGTFNEAPLTISISINQPGAANPVVFQNAGITPTINFTGTSLINEAGIKKAVEELGYKLVGQ